MRIKKQQALVVLTLGVGVMGLIAVRVIRLLTPQSIMNSLEVSFAGVTNEAGNILVTVTNCSRWQITYWPRIEVQESSLWPPYPDSVALNDLAKPRKLPPHASEQILISPPTNISVWRLWVDYRADTERNEVVKNTQLFCEKIGLGSVGYRIPWDLGGYVLLPKSKEPLNRKAD